MKVTYKKLEELPEAYVRKLRKLNIMGEFSLDRYSNVIEKDVNNEYTVYMDKNSEWIKQELDKIDDNFASSTLRPVCLANVFIEYGRVIKNRYGEDEQHIESVFTKLQKPIIRRADSKMFKFQAKCVDYFEEHGCKFIKGNFYNVTSIDIGGSYTYIGIYEFDGRFNSVNFQIYKDEKPYDIFADPELNPYL